MYKFLCLYILLISSLISVSQTYWRVENEHHDEILLTIDLNRTRETFEAYTRKDALKEIAGTFTYTLAKAAGKLKHAEIVYIDGNTRSKGDSLFLTGTFNYFDKQYPFSASVSGNQFIGKYTDTKSKQHPLTGMKVKDNRPLKDYQTVVNSAFSFTEKYLFNPAWLKSDDWLDFREQLDELKPKISDDYELAAAFFWLGKKLSFSPYTISKYNPEESAKQAKHRAGIKELKPQVALFEVNTLPSTKMEMDSIAAIIDRKGYSKLIIDLRGNYRNNPFVAIEMVNYISDRKIDAGVYLTRKWFDDNRTIPKCQDCQKTFGNSSGTSYTNGDLCKFPGRCLQIVPGNKTFKGKVYVLIDSKTSKVFEALTYVLKKERLAILVGQKTSGAFLLTDKIIINNEYELVLPVSDYFTCEGRSLDKIGVEPDIAVSGEDAMKYILKSL